MIVSVSSLSRVDTPLVVALAELFELGVGEWRRWSPAHSERTAHLLDLQLAGTCFMALCPDRRKVEDEAQAAQATRPTLLRFRKLCTATPGR